MNIAVIGGTGNQGRGLAVRWAAKGHTVYVGSRDASRAEEAARELGRGIKGGSNEAIAQAADVIALCVPYAALEATLQGIEPHSRGKIVVDMTVPLEPGRPPKYPANQVESAAEQTQAILSGSKVVGAFHNVAAGLLASEQEKLDIDVLVCGNDAEAKATVFQLVEDAGARAIDAGSLDYARTIERITALLIGLNVRYKKKHIGIRFTGVDPAV